MSADGHGTVPSHVAESLKILKDLKVRKWHNEVKKFIGRRINGFDTDPTWSRRNRRYGLLTAGKRSGGSKKLAIAVDTSGSMPISELQQAMAEAIAMVKAGNEVIIIQFDAKVNSVEKFRKNAPTLEITSRGGTCFADLMVQVDKLRCDGLVVFTDGEDSGAAKAPKTPVLFVYTTGHKPKSMYPFGRHIILDKK